MKRQEYFVHRLQTLKALHDAVGAMRSLSAHHFRRARQALVAARDYRDEMNQLIAEIGLRQPSHPKVAGGMLVLASDLGLCGDYNSRLARLAVAQAKEHGIQTIYSVGRRVRSALLQHGLESERSYDAPASLEGIPRLLADLAPELLKDHTGEKIGELHVVSAAFAGVGKFVPVSVRLLPIEPIMSASVLPPTSYVRTDRLSRVAIREFVYISLYEILLDALAAEHGMRLMAAESALEWLEESSTTASRRLATSRSETSTQELLDIVAGSRQRMRAIAKSNF